MLRGSSDSVEFLELLELLSDLGKTGRLQVCAGRTTATFVMEDGRILAVIGRIGATTFTLAGQERHDLWPESGLDLIAGIVNACHVTFYFEPDFGVGLDETHPGIETRILIRETAARAARWAQVHQVVPDLQARPVLEPEPGRIGGLELADWQLLARIGQVHTVAGLLRRVEGSRLDACEALSRLVKRGLVRLATSAASVADEPLGVPDPVESVTVIRPGSSPAPSGKRATWKKTWPMGRTA